MLDYLLIPGARGNQTKYGNIQFYLNNRFAVPLYFKFQGFQKNYTLNVLIVFSIIKVPRLIDFVEAN